MAIYNGRILMRKGNEADFDAENLMAGEWAVSLDKGIVRICLQAGTVIRMATYEAFEEDMKRVEEILLECQTVEEAVTRINTEVSTKANAVVELVEQAKTYRDEAEQFRNEAESFKNQAGEIVGIDIATTERAGISKPDGETLEIDPDGTLRVIGGGGVSDYEELENKPSINDVELSGNKTLEELGIASKEELDKTVFKVDTIIEKADLGIKETAIGEEIHLTDSADGKAVEYALYGKATQNTTSGKNLLINTATSRTVNGITFTVNSDGSVTLNGTATSTAGFSLSSAIISLTKGVTYTLTGGLSVSCRVDLRTSTAMYKDCQVLSGGGMQTSEVLSVGSEASFIPNNDAMVYAHIRIVSGQTFNNVTIYPMLRLASITDDTWEPYTNGPSPNPDFPQDIVVAGESYNLLENTATSKTENGVTFTVNEDGTVTANGTASASAYLTLGKLDKLVDGQEYCVSGTPIGEKFATSSFYVYDATDVVLYSDATDRYNPKFIYNASHSYQATCKVTASAKATNTIFYPMIRKASVTNDRYMPYGVGSVEVKSVGKNLLKNTATSKNSNGVIFTVNDDKTISASGTNTSATYDAQLDFTCNLKAGKYKFNGCKGGKSESDFYLLYYDNTNSKRIASIFNGADVEVNIENDIELLVILRIAKNVTVNNIVFEPMIRLASDTDDTYEPYKETLSTIPTTNGIAGIKVSSGGNYTDTNGQQWICDEVVKYVDGSGEYVERIKHYSLAIADMDSSEDYPGWKNVEELSEVVGKNKVTDINCLTNISNYVLVNTNNNNTIYFHKSNFNMTQTEWKTNHPNLVVDIYIARISPITTPLTAQQLADIETFYPVTNITNDFDCEMKVKYKADGKNYIDKRLALIEQALINNI